MNAQEYGMRPTKKEIRLGNRIRQLEVQREFNLQKVPDIEGGGMAVLFDRDLKRYFTNLTKSEDTKFVKVESFFVLGAMGLANGLVAAFFGFAFLLVGVLFAIGRGVMWPFRRRKRK